MADHDDDDYRGPATVRTDDREVGVEVVLRGHFQPIDGRFHWYGRLAAHDEVAEFAANRKTPVLLSTPEGEAHGVLSDPDPWGRYRITGTGRPPFPIPTDVTG